MAMILLARIVWRAGGFGKNPMAGRLKTPRP